MLISSNLQGSSCSPCQCTTHGTCSQGLAGTGTCSCATGWSGSTCAVCASGYWVRTVSFATCSESNTAIRRARLALRAPVTRLELLRAAKACREQAPAAATPTSRAPTAISAPRITTAQTASLAPALRTACATLAALETAAAHATRTSQAARATRA